MPEKEEIIAGIIELLKKRRFEEILTYLEDYIRNIPEIPVGKGDSEISDIIFYYASAKWELVKAVRTKAVTLERGREEVLQLAKKSLRYNRENEKVLWLIRECTGLFLVDSKYFKITAEGTYIHQLGEKSATVPFATVYAVVAESEQQALELIREIERDEIKDTIRFIDVDESPSKPELPLGVYSMKGLVGVG